MNDDGRLEYGPHTSPKPPIPAGPVLGPAFTALVEDLERSRGRRLWAAFILSLDPDVCASVLRGRRVLASRLDGEALRRALRGGPLPDPASYILVTAEMLDALVEAGPVGNPPWVLARREVVSLSNGYASTFPQPVGSLPPRSTPMEVAPEAGRDGAT
jgi:hypothetical protein